MSFQFVRILERELQAVGLTPLDIPPSAAEAATPRVAPASGENLPTPATIEDRTAFSAKAMSLSSSLREYAQDAVRPARRDPYVVTGWSEAGYLRDTGRGLSGEIRFTTAAGTGVTITAGTGEAGASDIRVRALKDGREHSFGIKDFSECRKDDGAISRPAPAYALPGSCGERPAEDPAAEALTYSPRTLGKKRATARAPLSMAC